MGFFDDAKNDLSAAGEAAQEGALDLDSMLDRIDPATEEGTGADAGASLASENEAGSDDEFLSKLSEALSGAGTDTAADAAPAAPQTGAFGEAVIPAETPVEEPVAFDAGTFEEAPAYEEAAPAPVYEEAVPAPVPVPVQETMQPVYAQEGGYTMDMETTLPATDENAVITAGMTVNGDIITSGNLELMGKVQGNVKASGKLTISGEITGDSAAAEIFADSARISGEVHSQGSVKVGQSTVIIGNISANGAVIAGAVKGDIDVHGPVILDTTAIVMGNIKSQSVQINNGAVIEGMCSQVYAEVNPSAFFDNLKG